MPSNATVLLFTDGLVERRGEHVETGLGRLRDTASVFNGTLEELLSNVVGGFNPGGFDDTALLGFRWMTARESLCCSAPPHKSRQSSCDMYRRSSSASSR
jgi:hypothetical protein